MNKPGQTSLDSVYFHLTTRCNLTCTYCYVDDRWRSLAEMQLDELGDVFESVVSGGISNIILTGGEPMLRTDLIEVLELFDQIDGIHVVDRQINSNGHNIDIKMAERLIGHVSNVRISLDGFERVNDTMRGTGSFRVAMDALLNLKAVGFEPITAVTVSSANIEQLSEFVKHLQSKGLYNFRFHNLRKLGRATGLKSLCVDQFKFSSEIRNSFEQWDTLRSHTSAKSVYSNKRARYLCGIGNSIAIAPNGDVYPCHALTDSVFKLGNIKNNSVQNYYKLDNILKILSNFKASDLWRASDNGDFSENGFCIGESYSSLITT